MELIDQIPEPIRLAITGTVVPIRVTFTKPVTVDKTGGTPTLALNAGPGGTAMYVSGSGTTVLTFDYTVHPGEMATDLDYTSADALTPNGGAIQYAASDTPATTISRSRTQSPPRSRPASMSRWRSPCPP